jgi:hypothetical protein
MGRHSGRCVTACTRSSTSCGCTTGFPQSICLRDRPQSAISASCSSTGATSHIPKWAGPRRTPGSWRVGWPPAEREQLTSRRHPARRAGKRCWTGSRSCGGDRRFRCTRPPWHGSPFTAGRSVVIDCQNGIPFFSPLVVGKHRAVLLVVHHVHQDQFSTREGRSGIRCW